MYVFFFQAEDGIRDGRVTGVQTCALPILPGAAEAADFMTDIWGMALAETRQGAYFLRGSGPFPYLFSLEEGPERFVRSTTFTCTPAALAALELRIAAVGQIGRA